MTCNNAVYYYEAFFNVVLIQFQYNLESLLSDKGVLKKIALYKISKLCPPRLFRSNCQIWADVKGRNTYKKFLKCSLQYTKKLK